MMSNAQHTPGPWRWELNEKHKGLHLVGGRPAYDLTIIEPTRWGMDKATLLIRDTAHDGMNILHKLHERRDWIAPFEGRAHHADWCANVVHPDMLLIAAAPELLEAMEVCLQLIIMDDNNAPVGGEDVEGLPAVIQARAAIARAKGL
jgi:hypothetical protein